DRNGGSASPFAFDADVYESDALWPASPIRVGEVASIGGARVLPVTIHPVRWRGSANEIEIASRVVLDIAWTRADSGVPAPRVSRAIDGILRRVAIVPTPISDGEDAWLPADGTYLIVCADSLCDAAAPLAEWKARKGFAVEVVPVSDIGESPTAAEIRTYLADRYANDERGLDYVLLVGDIDQMPTFLGLWGTLADHDYTTVDGDDYFADFIVGRLSGNTPDEIAVQVTKTLNYERAPDMADDAWFTSALTISGSDYFDDENAGYCADQAEGYGFPVADRYFQSNGKNTNDNVTASLEAGRSWISYFGHGWEEAWSSVSPQFSNSDAMGLENSGMPPAISSIACSNGAFDWGGDCFAEALMKAGEDKGAAAVFAAARLTPFFYTDSLGKAMARGYFSEGMDSFGAAAFYGKMGMYEEYPEAAGGQTQEVMQHFHIFGDPDLPVWSAVPSAFDEPVAVWDEIAKTLTVTITQGRGGVEGALVHIFGEGADFAARTDTDGVVTLGYETMPAEAWDIVVTARNRIPFEGFIEPLTEPGDDDTTGDDDTIGDDDTQSDDDAADDDTQSDATGGDSDGSSGDDVGGCGC
ncbi:MAG: hypothetical protein KJ042_07585, partial [Deltaproteobacteria bacterium]|nr:hypothetical protein [Deltaproteobacteria bacterium]